MKTLHIVTEARAMLTVVVSLSPLLGLLPPDPTSIKLANSQESRMRVSASGKESPFDYPVSFSHASGRELREVQYKRGALPYAIWVAMTFVDTPAYYEPDALTCLAAKEVYDQFNLLKSWLDTEKANGVFTSCRSGEDLPVGRFDEAVAVIYETQVIDNSRAWVRAHPFRVSSTRMILQDVVDRNNASIDEYAVATICLGILDKFQGRSTARLVKIATDKRLANTSYALHVEATLCRELVDRDLRAFQRFAQANLPRFSKQSNRMDYIILSYLAKKGGQDSAAKPADYDFL